jgi:hypothetical protein
MDTLYYYSLIRAYKWQMPNTACGAIKIFTKLNSHTILALGGPYTPVNLLTLRLLNYPQEKIIPSMATRPETEDEDFGARNARGGKIAATVVHAELTCVQLCDESFDPSRSPLCLSRSLRSLSG